MIKLYSAACGYSNSNSGDECSREIIERLFNWEVEVESEQTKLVECHLVAAGSIAQEIPPYYEGAVWGTGLMFGHLTVDTPQAKVVAVRGHRTRNRWPQAKNAAFGDPGLLVDRAYPELKDIPKRYKVGVIPHYVDFQNMGLREWLRNNRETTVGIDICGRLYDVLRTINECEYILSSSLHGLVFADSYGIPNSWIYLSPGISGGCFKYHDYYSVFGIEEPAALPFGVSSKVSDILAQVENYSRPGLEGIKDGLIQAWPFWKSNLK